MRVTWCHLATIEKEREEYLILVGGKSFRFGVPPYLLLKFKFQSLLKFQFLLVPTYLFPSMLQHIIILHGRLLQSKYLGITHDHARRISENFRVNVVI